MPVGQEILIALGANTPFGGDGPVETLRSALAGLQARGVSVRKVGRFYKTPCFPKDAGPDYVNACAALCSDLGPESLLEMLHSVEADHGRIRAVRWAARSLDLDLLAVGHEIVPDLPSYEKWRTLPLDAQTARAPDRLILPHPRLHERAFVLVPLMDVAPDWRHPVIGLTVRQMHNALPAEARGEVKPV
ncbi:2-amino-4-hydroxy-6-hydroxymethyldihydropteridine pyrophosphokinase [Citreicella sp. 357]|nr:2-amino-4-hydroxy-6-hydroxymethyldihydropteridine pyrophosphokinase [Citreicella sp. 357]